MTRDVTSLPRRTRALNRAAEQRVEAAAGRRSENIDDEDDERERSSESRAEEGHTDNICILEDENQHRGDAFRLSRLLAEV